MPGSTSKFSLSTSSSRQTERLGDSNEFRSFNTLTSSTSSSIGLSNSSEASTMALYSWPDLLDEEDQSQNDWGLHRAAKRGDIDLIKFALQNGQSPNNLKDGISPLHSAAWSGNESGVRLLLAYGAEVDIGSFQNHRSMSITDLMMDKNSSSPPIGFTPLHLASLYGHATIVRLLLDHGARSTLPDRNGFTPANLAQWSGHGAIAELLNIWSATHGYEGEKSQQNVMMNKEVSLPSNVSMHYSASDHPTNRSKNKLMSSLNKKGSIEHLSNAAAGFKASIQNSTKHVLSRVSSQPTLRSTNLPFSQQQHQQQQQQQLLQQQSQNLSPTSPTITSFASSIARDLKTKASTVFGSSIGHDGNQSRNPTHRPSLSSTFEKSSNSSEGRNSFAQSTSVLQMNANNTKVDGTIRKMMRCTGNMNLAGLSIRPGKNRERKARMDSRGELEMPRSASIVSSFFSSTDSLPIPPSSAKDIHYTSFDDRNRWETTLEAQKRSLYSPLNFDYDGYGSRMSDADARRNNEAPLLSSDLRVENGYGCPSPLSALDNTHDDVQEMLERTAESHDMLSKYKYACYGPSFRNKNANSSRSSPIDGFTMMKELSNAPDSSIVAQNRSQKAAFEYAEAIFQGAEEGYKWFADDGKPLSLRDMLADYGEALAREREEAKKEALVGTQILLFSEPIKNDDRDGDDDDVVDEQMRISTSLEGIMDLSGMSSSPEITDDTNLPETPAGSMLLTNRSEEKSGTCSTHSSSSANTIKRLSNQEGKNSSHLQPIYPFLLATSASAGQNKYNNDNVEVGSNFKSQKSTTFHHKHRRTSNYSPVPYNSKLSSASNLSRNWQIGERERERQGENRRNGDNKERDSFGSASSLSNVSCGTAI